MAATKNTQLMGLAALGARLGLRAMVQIVVNNRALVEGIAQEVFAAEDGRVWTSLSAGDRALWTARVQHVMEALGSRVGG